MVVQHATEKCNSFMDDERLISINSHVHGHEEVKLFIYLNFILLHMHYNHKSSLLLVKEVAFIIALPHQYIIILQDNNIQYKKGFRDRHSYEDQTYRIRILLRHTGDNSRFTCYSI
jgi:hypothetical protein